MPGPDEIPIDDEFGAPLAARPARSRRTILDEILIEGDPEGERGRVSMGTGGRVDLGGMTDASLPLADEPESAARRALLGGARGIGRAASTQARVAENAGAASTEADADLFPDVSRRERRQLAGEMRDTSAIGDALRAANPFSDDGARSASRSRERLRNLRDQLTLGQEQIEVELPFVDTPFPEQRIPLGGRTSLTPIVGSDERGAAPLVGFADTATLGFADEVGGAARAALTDETYDEARDALRERASTAREQAPEATALGQAAGTVPLMAIPGASAASSTIGLPARLALATGQGAQLGAMQGFGSSEADLFDDPIALATDTAIGGIEGGILGGAGQVASDALGAVARGPSRAPRDVVARSAARDDALLAATGHAGNNRAAVEAFDFGDGHDAIMRSRARAAQTLRDTRAVPQLGGMRATTRSIEDARAGATGVMDDVRTAMGVRGPTGADVAQRLRDRASANDSPTGVAIRDVLEDFAARYGGTIDEAGNIVPTPDVRSPDAPIPYDDLVTDLGNIRDMGTWSTRAGRDVPLTSQARRIVDRELRGAYDDSIEAALLGRTGGTNGPLRSPEMTPEMREAAERLGPDPVGRYRQARQQFATLEPALENARRGEAALAGHRLLGPSEQVGMLGGGSVGAPVGGALGFALAGPAGAAVGAPAGAALGALSGGLAQRGWRGLEPRARATGLEMLYQLAEQYPHELTARLGGPAVRWLLERGGRLATAADAAPESDAAPLESGAAEIPIDDEFGYPLDEETAR